MVIVSAGIRPRDELARAAGLAIGERGGIVVDDALRTSDPRIFAIGECAVHRGVIYGLVAPGYEMADVAGAAARAARTRAFAGADLSAKLKLLGVDVASFGDSFADSSGPQRSARSSSRTAPRASTRSSLFDPTSSGCSAASWSATRAPYAAARSSHAKTGAPVPAHPRELLFGARGRAGGGERGEPSRRGADLLVQQRHARAISSARSREQRAHDDRGGEEVHAGRRPAAAAACRSSPRSSRPSSRGAGTRSCATSASTSPTRARSCSRS